MAATVTPTELTDPASIEVDRLCRHCGRDIPASAHHRRRYCDDRACRAAAKKARRAKRRPARVKAREGDTRRVNGALIAYLPGHPLDSGNGWVSVRRAALFEALDGDDPACATCGALLDWAADGKASDRVCVVRPKAEPAGDLPLCPACLTGVGVAGSALHTYLHPLAWGEATGAIGGPVENGAPLYDRGAAAPGGSVDVNLPAALAALLPVWDGSERSADLLAAAATLLALHARRGAHGRLG